MSITAANCPSPADAPLRGLERNFRRANGSVAFSIY